MLIIPLTGKTGRHHLPPVRPALTLANCLVLFVLQSGGQATDRAQVQLLAGLALPGGLAGNDTGRAERLPAFRALPVGAAGGMVRAAMFHGIRHTGLDPVKNIDISVDQFYLVCWQSGPDT